MWRQLESYKNQFLQLKAPYMNIELANELVTEEFKRRQAQRKKTDKCTFPNKAPCAHSTYFEDHAALAYGFRTVGKLVEDLCSDKPELIWQSLNSFSEVLQNPWQAQRALDDLDIVRKLQNLLLRLQHTTYPEFRHEKLRILKIFYLLSKYVNGAREIIRRPYLLTEFYRIILLRLKGDDLAADILLNLSEKPEILQYAIDNTNAFLKLTQVFSDDPCTPFYKDSLWEHLSHFLQVQPEVAIQKGFFELLHERIVERRPLYHKHCIKCFALLLRCSSGEERFAKVDGVNMIYQIISLTGKDKLDTYEHVTHALLQGVTTKSALWRCREYTDLPDILVGLAMNTQNAEEQLYSLQALRQIGQMPTVKQYMREGNVFKQLLTVNCLNPYNKSTRDWVLEWLEREIFDSGTDFSGSMYNGQLL